MNDLVKAARDALDLIEKIDTGIYSTDEVVFNLRAAVERAEQGPENEPVAWITPKGSLSRHACFMDCAPLYRHPPRPTGLDQLLERIRFLEQQIADKNQ